MVRLARAGKIAEARTYHYRLLEIIETIFEDGSPSGIKAALEIIGLAPNNLRLPLVKVNKAVLNQLQVLIEDLNEQPQ
jgi:4-hydroxy-tetrahydrodipicolinate synthase